MKRKSYLRRQIVRIIGKFLVRGTNVTNCQTMRLGKIEQASVLGAINRTENVFGTSFCLDLKLERTVLGGFTGKVHVIDFIETNVNWGLVKKFI